MEYMEYQEVQVPEEIQAKLEKLREAQDLANPPILGAVGFFDWVNKMSKEEGWSVVWQGFNFPYLVLERKVFVMDEKVKEEVQKYHTNLLSRHIIDI